MKHYRNLILILILVTLQSCSPFGNSSVIDSISETISDIFDSKTTTVDFGTGGGQSVVTASNYKVTFAFGTSAQTPVTGTNDGYSVLSSIKTKTTTE